MCRRLNGVFSLFRSGENFLLTQMEDKRVLSYDAEVVKLVDAVDSKSTGFIARAGSSPAFGTIKRNKGARDLQQLIIYLFERPFREEDLEEI